MPDTRHHETEIFAQARRLPAAQRADCLAKACGEDAALRARLEALLRVEDHVGDFLEDPAHSSGVRDLLDTAIGGHPGKVGRYQLREKIGEGGCGVIYLAEQTEPVRRQVALKIIKPGMGTREVITRFEVERQALALMDHPGIAKVFDAGETESGRPYFVMELIRGIKITEYCDRNALTTEERLELFIRTCEAVQHAHQKGVIHRDLKPSNILVTATPEGTAQPVVIDFGIAKATNDLRLTDKTLFTAVEMLIGTPTYMSPEQTAYTGADVDTRSDIYSLGVLLYELLTGSTPFDAGELLQLGIDEVRRAIREQEPPRPSARLGRLSPESLAAVAARRRTEPGALIRSLRGELDWIVLKALEKDRTRRYPTAHGLALDVRRQLNNEPVYARPPSSAYRFQKTVRRNKLVFGAAAAILAALVAGVVVSTWQMVEARKSERRAQAQALAARRIAYSSDMNAVGQALKDNNLGRARMLLNRQKPQAGELDLRDWEWRYLWSQARADEHEILITGPRWSSRPMSFSDDGRLLARSPNGNIVVTDVVSRRLVFERAQATRPVFTHQGNRLAFVTRESGTNRDVITLRDLAAEKETQFLSYPSTTEWIGFTPDDRVMLTISVRPGVVRTEVSPADLTAWEVGTGRQLWQRTIGGRPPWVRWRPYVISPDGTAFAAALPYGRVHVVDTKDGRDRFTITATEELSLCVRFSPDNATLLTGAGFSDPLIRLWDARTGESRGSLKGHGAYVTDLLFTADGTRLISSSADQTIRLWEWATKKPAGVFRGHLDEVDGIALAPGGQTLASRCKDGSVYLWNLNNPSGNLGYQTLPRPLRQGTITAQFTADSRSIVGVEATGSVTVWDAQTGRELRRFPRIPKSRYMGISHDGQWVATTEGHDLTVWDASTGSEHTRLRFEAPHAGLRDVKFLHGGKLLVTVSGPPDHSVLETWDTRSWARTGSVRLPFKPELDYSVNFEPKSFTLPNTYGVLADKVFQLFDVTRIEQAPKVLRKGQGSNDWSGAPDGRLLVAADSSGMIRGWEVGTLQEVTTLKGFQLGAHSVTFSRDGRRLGAGSNGREAVRLWDVETWQEVLTLGGEGSRFSGLKFSPDSRHLLAINDAGLTHIWTAPTWEEIAAEEVKPSSRPPGGGSARAESKKLTAAPPLVATERAAPNSPHE